MIPGQTRQNIKILIDVEAQKDDAPGYSIPLRGLFYCCRMISSQLETEFTNSQSDSVKYGNLKKVYSIWICTETAQCRANTIEKYSIGKDFLYGYNQDEHRYDLMSTIIINISKTYNTDGCDNELICMLTNLFNKDMDADDKIRTLEQDYGIPMTAEIKEGVDSMCTYTEAVEQRGIEKGIKEGYDQAIFSLVQRGTISVEQGAQELKTDTDTFVRMMEEAGYKAPASV